MLSIPVYLKTYGVFWSVLYKISNYKITVQQECSNGRGKNILVLLRFLLPLENRQSVQMRSQLKYKRENDIKKKNVLRLLVWGKHLMVVEKLEVILNNRGYFG